jgi:hypothetical protein
MTRPFASRAAAVLEPLPFKVQDIRVQALERLYLRREAVDELIRSLEQYEETVPRRAPCIPFSADRKCS